MDAVSDRHTETVVVMSSAQVGKTEIINNIVGYYIHQDPSPILLVQPILDMAKSWSRDRLAPMLRDTPVLKGAVREAKSRDSGNTIFYKSFPGGHITMTGANSPTNLSSRPIRMVLFDEVDRYPPSAGTEGDPISLGKKRTNNFWNRKEIQTSTPTIKGTSRIEFSYENSDKRRYHVPCPHCDEYQVLKWAQVQWEEGQPETAVYICEHNGCIITNSNKPLMLKKGEWRAENPFKGIAGFHLNELYSPWVKWAEMVANFLIAKKSPEQLKTFINTSLAETWEEEGEKLEEDFLLARREHWGDNAPEDVLLVTCAVDVQGDRLEAELVGWGAGEERWSLDYRIFYGDPAQPEIWGEVDSYLHQRIRTQDGRQLTISCACIDSGGHHSLQVYGFCKGKHQQGIYAIKGGNESSRALITKPSTNNKLKVLMYTIGVNSGKERIISRLQLTEPGPGYYHFPADREKEYFSQLLSEKAITKYNKGFPYKAWVKTRVRNEAFDLAVYNLAALYITGVNLDRLAVEVKRPAAPPPKKEEKQGESWLPRKQGWLDR